MSFRVALIAGLLALALPRAAAAYPDFIAQGYTNCITCH
jgi:hypothetical protein